MENTICYKTKTPTYYNKGTKWETSCNTFLLCYTSKSKQETEKIIAALVKEKPAECFGQKINWNEIECLFVKEQESMN